LTFTIALTINSTNFSVLVLVNQVLGFATCAMSACYSCRNIVHGMTLIADVRSTVCVCCQVEISAWSLEILAQAISFVMWPCDFNYPNVTLAGKAYELDIGFVRIVCGACIYIWHVQRFASVGWPGVYETCCLPIW